MIKTAEELDAIREGGRLLGKILEELVLMVCPGATTEEIDRAAESKIRAVGGRPSFKGYAPHGVPPFPSTICACINDEVVHAPAIPPRTLKEGDIFSIDIGMEWPIEKLQMTNDKLQSNGNGFFTDTAITVPVGHISPKANDLIEVTREALERGIAAVKAGGRISDIGKAVQSSVEERGYSVVRALVGHGVGYAVHELPEVPNYVDANTPAVFLASGMVIAIEPMVNHGSHLVVTAPDRWTIKTKDGALSAHFEHTLIVTDRGADVVTRRPKE